MSARALFQEQHSELSVQYPGYIVFLLLGDFLETFGEDAKTVSAACHVSLIERDGWCMAGFPRFSAQSYLADLLAAGHKAVVAAGKELEFVEQLRLLETEE